MFGNGDEYASPQGCACGCSLVDGDNANFGRTHIDNCFWRAAGVVDRVAIRSGNDISLPSLCEFAPENGRSHGDNPKLIDLVSAHICAGVRPHAKWRSVSSVHTTCYIRGANRLCTLRAFDPPLAALCTQLYYLDLRLSFCFLRISSLIIHFIPNRKSLILERVRRRRSPELHDTFPRHRIKNTSHIVSSSYS